MTAAEQHPEHRHPSGAGPDRDGLEPVPTWAGDTIAAQRFGSPEEIRAALLPEQLAEFDDAFNAALAIARQTLRLDQLRHVLRMWRRQALMTEWDPEGHRQMLRGPADRPFTIRQRAVERPQGRTRSLTADLMTYTLDLDPVARAQIRELRPAAAVALANHVLRR